MSSVIASHPRTKRSDIPHYVRKFRLESNELNAIAKQPFPRKQVTSHALIWTKVVAMSLTSSGLLYLAVLFVGQR